MVAVHDSQGVVDAATAVDGRIDQHHDVLERHGADGVVHFLLGGGGEVTVGIEGIEMTVQRGAKPLSAAGHAHAGIRRGHENGADGEPVPARGKGLVVEQSLRDALRIAVELGFLGGVIAFRDHDNVDGLQTRQLFVNLTKTLN